MNIEIKKCRYLEKQINGSPVEPMYYEMIHTCICNHMEEHYSNQYGDGLFIAQNDIDSFIKSIQSLSSTQVKD